MENVRKSLWSVFPQCKYTFKEKTIWFFNNFICVVSAPCLRQVPPRIFEPILCFCKEIQTTTTEKIVGASYIPNTNLRRENKLKVALWISLHSCLVSVPQLIMFVYKIFQANEGVKIESVGAFQKLPMVMPSIDIIQSALRKAKKVSPTKGNWLFMWLA